MYMPLKSFTINIDCVVMKLLFIYKTNIHPKQISKYCSNATTRIALIIINKKLVFAFISDAKCYPSRMQHILKWVLSKY